MPIKKIIHKFFGGLGNTQSNVKKTANKIVQMRSEIDSVLSQGFFQTAVNTKRSINVIGIA